MPRLAGPAPGQTAMPAQTVCALLFDVVGTVVDWYGSISAEVQQGLALRHPGLDPGAVALAWRSN